MIGWDKPLASSESEAKVDSLHTPRSSLSSDSAEKLQARPIHWAHSPMAATDLPPYAAERHGAQVQYGDSALPAIATRKSWLIFSESIQTLAAINAYLYQRNLVRMPTPIPMESLLLPSLIQGNESVAMIDQMFTAENFRRIYDSENRRGVDLAKRFFPTLEPFTMAVREKVQEVRKLRKLEAALTPSDFEAQLTELKNELSTLKSSKSAAIDSLMDDIAQKVLEPSFKIDLSKKMGPKGKPVYCIDAEPRTFFVSKQLQRNIHGIYGVKQSDRHDLVCQLRDMLGSRFPFELIRTDISSFYERIDRKSLVDKLDRDQLLSPASKKYVKQVLDSYGTISGTPLGIPRGVGISAYLAELYLQPIDKAIRRIPGLVLYCRFVDDIVAVFARPPIGKSLGSYKDLIISTLASHGLAHNATKTSEFILPDTSTKKFEYLGYRFRIKSSEVEISPSAAKIAKYRTRIDSSFTAYWHETRISSKRAFRQLVGRIKFITGNTRLSNSKSRAATGVYFSNSIATDMSAFKRLDNRLQLRIKQLKRSSLQKQLKKLKFSTGFAERRYHNFSTKELQVIVRAWKNG